MKPSHFFTHLPLLSASEFGSIHMNGVYFTSEGRNILGAGHSVRCCVAFLDWVHLCWNGTRISTEFLWLLDGMMERCA
jgi:hypothetical protein